MFLQNKYRVVPGGALYYVIFVVFVLSAIVSLFILQRGVSLRQVHHELKYYSRIDDLNSALTLYLSAPETYQNSAHISMVLFDDSTRLVQFDRKSHGILDMVTASNTYRGKRLSKTLLVGKNPFYGDSVALWVPDQRQAIYASGNSIINGNAVIPAKGMQRASIEGKPLRRSEPINGRISVSGSSLPKLAAHILTKIEDVLDIDSLMRVSADINRLHSSSIRNSFTEEMLWYSSDSDFQISGIEAKGRIGFVSPGTILIKNDTRLNRVLVSASRIIVEDGFEGEVQLFARDSLVIGQDCRLTFPSLACIHSHGVSNLFLKVGKGSTMEGSLIVNQENVSAKKPLLSLEEESVVVGQIYHQGIVELEGEVHGSLYCEGFYKKTKRAFYENHLLDNVIDFHQLPELFVTIDLIGGYNDELIDILDSSL